MIIIPAIDLRGGSVVRLTRGAFDRETIYGSEPEAVLERWQNEGAAWIHVVDLDGAKTGTLRNLQVLKALIKKAKVPIQFGGGLRDYETVSNIIHLGVERVVIGTKARDKIFLQKLTRRFGGHIGVALDLKNGKSQIRGWQDQQAGGVSKPEQMCEYFARAGVKTIVVTDVSRDGTLEGPNLGLLTAFLSAARMKVILSGGIANLADLEALSRIKAPNFFGVIVGKALYENKFKLSEAIERFQEVTA